MFLIFKRLWHVNWAEQWQYRANLIMDLLYWLVSSIIYLAVWTSIAESKGDVNGYTANDFITYYMILLIVDQMTSNIIIHIFGYKVQDGSLSGELIKPIHPMLTNTLVNDIAFKTLNLMWLVPIWLVLAFVFKPDFSSVTLVGILFALPAIVLGYAIIFLLSGIITSLAFWTTRVYSIHEFYYALILLFAGQFVPLKLMPELIQTIARFPLSVVHVPAHPNDPREIIHERNRARLHHGIDLADRRICVVHVHVAARRQAVFRGGSVTCTHRNYFPRFSKSTFKWRWHIAPIRSSTFCST